MKPSSLRSNVLYINQWLVTNHVSPKFSKKMKNKQIKNQNYSNRNEPNNEKEKRSYISFVSQKGHN